MPASYPIAAQTILGPPEQPLTQSQLLAVFDRVLDPAWLLPLKQPGPGYEVLQAYAAMWARVSQAAVNALNVFTLSSQGGAFALGYVAFTRNSSSLPYEVVKAGTMVTTSNGNRVFFTVDDAVFAIGATTATDALTGQPSIPVQAAAQDWQWNVPGQVNAANGDMLLGDIDTITLPIVQDASGELLYDPAIAVQNTVPAAGGRPAVLDQLAADQGLARQPGESDIALSTRMRQLPDTVTPHAVQRVVASVLGPYGVAATVQEPLGVGVLPAPGGYSGILVGFMDADPPPVGGAAVTSAIGLWYFDQNNPAYVTGAAGWPPGPGLDVEIPLPPGNIRQLGLVGPANESESTSRGFFRVAMPWIGGVNPGLGFAFYGSTGVGSAVRGAGTDLLYPLQGSFINGPLLGDYPWPSAGFFDAGSYDGSEAITPTSSVAGQLYNALAGAVAGGVGFEIVVVVV